MGGPLEELRVGHRFGEYPIYVGSGAVRQLEAIAEPHRKRRAVVIYGAGVPPEHVTAVTGVLGDVDQLEIDDGEQGKMLGNVDEICGALIDRGFRRDSIAYIVGGGTAGDTGGLAVSLFLRGIPFVHVPTTLLAQVDSSIGGKLAVNHPHGKNMIGIFQAPVAVVCDTDVLSTLSDRAWRSGLFEILKAGIIDDRELFEMLEQEPSVDLLRGGEHESEIISRSIAVKAKIVSEDETEGDRRRLLNLGHTLGHGLEVASDYGLTHGDAVAWGMIGAVAVASSRSLIAKPDAKRIVSLIMSFGPEVAEEISRERVLELVEHDKKFRQGRRVMVLPAGIGRCEIVDVSLEDLEKGLDEIF